MSRIRVVVNDRMQRSYGWRAIARHVAAIRHDCDRGDLQCRRRQRQAVLHWAYDSRRL